MRGVIVGTEMRFQRKLMSAVTLAALAVGAVGPIFQAAAIYKIVAAPCVLALAALAAIPLFRTKR